MAQWVQRGSLYSGWRQRMSYINQFRLIQAIVEGKPPNSKELLADVNPDAVHRALERSKDGVPEPVAFTNMPMEEEHFCQNASAAKEAISGNMRIRQRQSSPGDS